MAERTMRIYGALDIAFACLYVFMFWSLVPAYSAALRWGFGLLSAYMVVTGVGLLLLHRWARLLGLILACGLLGLTFVVFAMLVAAAGYLRGVYGAFGQGASYATLVGAALVLEVFGLIGAFQLRAMLRPEVREFCAR
jgi:hypothetical protein